MDVLVIACAVFLYLSMGLIVGMIMDDNCVPNLLLVVLWPGVVCILIIAGYFNLLYKFVIWIKKIFKKEK